MSGTSWNKAHNGAWSDAANWTAGVPDSTTADATIAIAGKYTVTLDSGTTIAVDSLSFDDTEANFALFGDLILAGTLASLTFDGSRFTMGSGGEITGGTLDFDSGTFLNQGGTLATADFSLGAEATIALGGHALTLAGTSRIGGALNGNGSAGSSLIIIGSAVIPEVASFSTLVNDATLADAGTITQRNDMALGRNANDSSSVIISSNAVYDMAGNSSILEYGAASVSNAGLLEVTGGGIAGVSATFGLHVLDGFSNTGTILAGKNNVFYLDTGGNIAGTLTGGGKIVLDRGNFTLAPSIEIEVATFGVGYYGLATLGSNLDLAQSFSADDVIDLNGYALTLAGNSTLAGAFDGNGATGNIVLVTGHATLPNSANYAYLENNTTLVDAGTITDESLFNLGTYYEGGPATDNSSLIIETGGVFNLAGISSYDGIIQNSTGTIGNAGLIIAAPGNCIQPFINSSGTILAGADGFLSLQGGGSFAGTLAGPGGIDFDGGNFTFSPTLAIDVRSLAFNDGVVTLGHSLDLAQPTEIGQWGSIALNGYGLTLSGRSTISGTLYGNGSAGNSLVVTGDDIFGDQFGPGFTNNANLVDAGKITQDDDLVLGGTTGVDTSSLIIDAGAVYDLAGVNEGIFQEGAGSVSNAGLLTATNAANSFVEPFITNTGTVLVAANSGLAFDGGGIFGGQLAGAGEIDFDGGTFTLSPGLVVSIATLGFESGLFEFEGNLKLKQSFEIDTASSIALNGHILALSGSGQLNGSFYGNGSAGSTIIVTGDHFSEDFFTTAYAQNDVTLVDAGTITQDDYHYLVLGSDSATDDSALVIKAGAVYDLGVGNIEGGGGASVANAGLLESTERGGSVDPDFTNTGTVLAAPGGYLEFFGDISNFADGALTGGTWEAAASGSLAGTLVLFIDPVLTRDAANIILDGAGAEIYTGLTTDETLETSLTAITARGTLQNLAGRDYNTANTLTDAGVIDLAGTFAAAALDITSIGLFQGSGTLAGAVQNAGSILASGALTLSGPVTGTGLLSISASSDLILDSAAAATQTVKFGAGATLTLGDIGTESPVLSGLKISDVIDIAETTVSAVSISGTSLLITLSGGQLITETLAAKLPGERFAISADGGTGSDLTLVEAATDAVTLNAGNDLLLSPMAFISAASGTASQLNGDTLAHFAVNDRIDITNLAPAGASLSYSGTDTAGTLSISESGLGVAATLTFASGTHLSASLFSIGSDGHGGSFLG